MKKISAIFLAALLTISLTTTAFADDLKDYKKHGHRSKKWNSLVEAGIEAGESGNLDAASNFFDQAMEKGCKDGLVYFNMALISESNGDYAGAVKYFKLSQGKLAKNYPKNIATRMIHEHIGRALFSLGDMAGAKAELEKALVRQGENFTIMFLLGSIARQQGDDRSVVEFYNRALALPPPPGINAHEVSLTLMIEIGRAYFALKKYDKSEAIWNQILTLYPGHPIAKKYQDTVQRKKSGAAMEESEKRILKEILK